MFNIRDLLNRANNRQSKELFFRKVVSDLLREKYAIEVAFDDISIRGGTLHLKGLRGAALSVLYIKKAEIISEINRLQDTYRVADMR